MAGAEASMFGGASESGRSLGEALRRATALGDAVGCRNLVLQGADMLEPASSAEPGGISLGESAVALAARHGKPECLKLFLDLGGPKAANAKGALGESLGALAASCLGAGAVDCLLLASHAQGGPKLGSTREAIAAAREGNQDALRWLWEWGGPKAFEAVDDFGRGPVLTALLHGRSEAARYAMAKSPDWSDRRDKEGADAWMCAARSLDVETAKVCAAWFEQGWLRPLGLSKDAKGIRPLDVASEAGALDICLLWWPLAKREQGAGVVAASAARAAARRGQEELLRFWDRELALLDFTQEQERALGSLAKRARLARWGVSMAAPQGPRRAKTPTRMRGGAAQSQRAFQQKPSEALFGGPSQSV